MNFSFVCSSSSRSVGCKLERLCWDRWQLIFSWQSGECQSYLRGLACRPVCLPAVQVPAHNGMQAESFGSCAAPTTYTRARARPPTAPRLKAQTAGALQPAPFAHRCLGVQQWGSRSVARTFSWPPTQYGSAYGRGVCSTGCERTALCGAGVPAGQAGRAHPGNPHSCLCLLVLVGVVQWSVGRAPG